MNLLDFAQFGVAVFSMGVLAYAIRLFIGFMKNQEDNFTEVLKNHLKHNTESLNQLKQILKEVSILLRKNNR